MSKRAGKRLIERDMVLSANAERENTSISHYVFVNEIAVNIAVWGNAKWIMTDHLVREVNRLAGKDGFAKDYNSVIQINVAGNISQIAVEYEHTRKASSEYKELLDSLKREEHISILLFVCANEAMRKILIELYNGLRNFACYVLVQEFGRSIENVKAQYWTMKRGEVGVWEINEAPLIRIIEATSKRPVAGYERRSASSLFTPLK